MLFELYEIQKQNTLIQSIQQSRQKSYNQLVLSYSQKDKTKKSLREKFQFVLKQSALLIHMLREIQQEVKHKQLLPKIFDNHKINKLLYSNMDLPDWFQHVFQKQYQKEKHSLQAVGLKIYKLHELSQKSTQLVKEHWNLETLFSRYQNLNQKQFENIDIIEEVESFKRLHDNCKQIFKNFLDMMAKKVLQFLQKTVQSTLIYSNNMKKVRSTDNLQSHRTLNYFHQNPIIPNHNPLKISYLKQTRPNIATKQTLYNDYSIHPQLYIKQTDKTINKFTTKNNPNLQYLKQKQKVNNQFFWRKSIQNNNNKSFETSLTNKLSGVRSQSNKLYLKENSSNLKLEYRNSKVKNYRNQSQESDLNITKAESILKRYNSSSNLYLAQNDVKNNNISKANSPRIPQVVHRQHSLHSTEKHNLNNKQTKCLHHCPHHDRHLNNHCSKHCDKLCQHEKQYSNNYGLNLIQMDKQFYAKRQNQRSNGFISDRQTYNKASNTNSQTNRINNIYLSNHRENMKINTSRSKQQQNYAINRPYLRNSHQKHLSSTKYSNYASPDKQNMRSYDLGKIKNSNLSPQHYRINISPRVSQYYFS